MPPPEPTDHLRELRDRIRATQEAAGRIAQDIPPAGWATPEGNRAAADEVEALAALLRTLRGLVPPELQEQVTEVLRQVLLLLRSLIDWWVARLEEGARGPAPARAGTPVEEIRID
jgi:HAMP domain-containing protein